MQHKKRLLSLFLALVLTIFIFPTVAKEHKASASVSSLKIGSFNIKNAGGGSQFDNIANQIREHNLDVIGLQEVDYYTGRCNHDTMKQIASRLGYYYAYFPTISYEGGKYGIGTLSRYPIESTWTKRLSYVNEPRILSHCLIKVSDTYTFNFYNTHLDTNGGAREKALADINNNLTFPYVLVGDFNCAPTTQDNYIKNSIWVHNPNNKPATYQSGSCIDNIIASEGHYAIKSSGVRQSGISDHYMVWADLSTTSAQLEGHFPIDLGADFAGHIRQTSTGLYFTDKDYNVSVSEGVFDESQTFHFVRQHDGSYTISSFASGACFDVDEAVFEDGTNIKMHGQNGHVAQKFFIYYIKGNFYIRTVIKEKMIDINASDGNVQLYGSGTGIDIGEIEFQARSLEILKINMDNSEWNSYLGAEFTAYIRNSHSGLLMTADGDNIIFKESTYEDDQKWIVTRNEYGGHVIKSAKNGKVLDVTSASLDHRADINLYEANGSKAQSFFFIDAGESRFYIKPSYSATVMDMDSEDHEIHACNYANHDEAVKAQVFEIITENHYGDGRILRDYINFGDNFEAKISLIYSDKFLTAGSGVSLEDKTSDESQIWHFTYDKKWNAYKITSNSGKVLDVQGAGWNNGTALQLYESNDSTAQRFRFYAADIGFLISPVHTQKVMDIDSNTGKTVQLYGNAPSEQRLFILTPVSTSGKKPVDLGASFTGTIKNISSDLYLTGRAEGVLSCTSEPSEWIFTRQNDGSYKIKNNAFNMNLDVFGACVNPGTNVQLWEDNDSSAQNFYIFESNNGYVLKHANSSLVLDMDSVTKETHIYPHGNIEPYISAQTFEISSNSSAIKSISVSKTPQKTNYTIGEKLDTTGLEIAVAYSDGTTKTVKSGYTISPTEAFTTVGNKTITVKYGEKTTTFTVVVSQNASDKITLKDNSPYSQKGNFIKNVSTKTSASQLLSQFTNHNIVVFDEDGNEISSTSICGTGYSVNLIVDGKIIDSLQIVITGDVDGSGVIDSTDYMRIKGAFLGTYTLIGAYRESGDVDGSGIIDSTDYMRIKGAFLGTYTIS